MRWRPQGDSNPRYRRERAMSWASRRWGRTKNFGGARRDRTADLLHAMQALSQLSYGPTRGARKYGTTRGMSRTRLRFALTRGRGIMVHRPTKCLAGETFCKPLDGGFYSRLDVMAYPSRGGDAKLPVSADIRLEDSGVAGLQVLVSAGGCQLSSSCSAGLGSGCGNRLRGLF